MTSRTFSISQCSIYSHHRNKSKFVVFPTQRLLTDSAGTCSIQPIRRQMRKCGYVQRFGLSINSIRRIRVFLADVVRTCRSHLSLGRRSLNFSRNHLHRDWHHGTLSTSKLGAPKSFRCGALNSIARKMVPAEAIFPQSRRWRVLTIDVGYLSQTPFKMTTHSLCHN